VPAELWATAVRHGTMCFAKGGGRGPWLMFHPQIECALNIVCTSFSECSAVHVDRGGEVTILGALLRRLAGVFSGPTECCTRGPDSAAVRRLGGCWTDCAVLHHAIAQQHEVAQCARRLSSPRVMASCLLSAGGQRDHAERGPAAPRRRHPGCRGAARHHTQVHQRAGARPKLMLKFLWCHCMSLHNARSVALAQTLPAAGQSILRAPRRVICMSCGDVTARQPFQDLLARLNPRMAEYVAALPEDAARSGQLDREMPESVRSAVQLLASDGCMGPVY
jgi:hypothetical protein